MASFTRLSIHRLLPSFSWTRQRQVPSRGHHFLQVEVMSPAPPQQFPIATELILFQDKNPHHELSYTSLRDLLATNARHVHPIKPKEDSQELELDERPAIKNRLVELAARAYLLPTHVQTTPANQFFSRQWARLTNRRHSHQSNLSLQLSAVSCLHLVDITRAFCSLFKLSHLRPQPVLRL